MTIEVVPVSGGTPRPVIRADYEAYHPFLSPSGRWLYFQQNHKNLFRIPARRRTGGARLRRR